MTKTVKRPAKKKVATSAKKTATKKTAAKKKTPAKTAKKTTTKVSKTKKSSEAPKKRGGFVNRELDAMGFVPGSDSSIIAHALVEGGESRSEVINNATEGIKASSGLLTRSGKEKYIPSMTSGILTRLLEAGYTVESSYKVVPPADVRKALSNEKRKAARKRK